MNGTWGHSREREGKEGGIRDDSVLIQLNALCSVLSHFADVSFMCVGVLQCVSLFTCVCLLVCVCV